MNAEQHVPQFRFKGFSDSWEQHKLSDGTNKIGDGLHGTPKYSEDGDVYFVNGNNLVNGQIVITSETKRVTSNEQSKDDKALNENTILMSINGTIGNLAWYRGENLMLGKSAAYIEVSDFDKKFIYTYLQTRPVKDYYLNSLTGTTIKNLGLKAIRNTNIYTPTIDEQAKIGVLFQNLDMTITLHQRKLAKLKELKKGYLQKLFPQNSEKVPEFRFKGYSDAWEKRELGEIFNVVTDYVANGSFKSLRQRVSTYSNPNFAYMIRLQDASNNWKGPWLYTDQQSYSFLAKTKLHPGDILMSNVGSVGKFFLVPDLDRPMTLAPNAVLLRSMTYSTYFLFQLLQTSSMTESINEKTTPGVQQKINKTDFKKIITNVPTLNESSMVGQMLFLLDNLIAATQCKLDLLKKLKKGYLQKMFC